MEVEKVHSTSFKPTMKNLSKMFAMHGAPNRIESDNRPLFNSTAFEQFALREGFKLCKVPSRRARGNGEGESCMKLINKTEQIEHLQKTDNDIAMQEMLTRYRSTPRVATELSAYEAMMGRKKRTKLDHHTTGKQLKDDNAKEQCMNERDKEYKQKMK